MRRLLLVGLLALAGLAGPQAAQTATKTVKVAIPADGNVVIAQLRGTALGSRPPTIRMKNPGVANGIIVASSVWRARTGKGFDGILVLINPTGGPNPGPGRAAALTGTFLVLNTTLIYPRIAFQAVLAAILFPVFAQAREAARRNHCNNNLKQIALAAHKYYGAERVPGYGPGQVTRFVCGGFLEEVLPNSPNFWAHLNHPYCGFHTTPFPGGTNEIVFNGSCNFQTGGFIFHTPSPLMPINCLPPQGATCQVNQHDANFQFLAANAAYTGMTGNIQTNGPPGNIFLWELSVGNSGQSAFLPSAVDPTAGNPIFK